MNERDLRGLLDQVKAGALSRRVFLRRMAAVGLAAPFANQLLARIVHHARPLPLWVGVKPSRKTLTSVG